MVLSEEIMVVPQWTAQPWYWLLARILREIPLLLITESQHSSPTIKRDKLHLFGKNLKVMSCRLSGRPSKIKEFHSQLMDELILSSWRHRTHKNISNILGQMVRLYLRTICQYLSSACEQVPGFPPEIVWTRLGWLWYQHCKVCLVLTYNSGVNMEIGKHLLVHRFIKWVF